MDSGASSSDTAHLLENDELLRQNDHPPVEICPIAETSVNPEAEIAKWKEKCSNARIILTIVPLSLIVFSSSKIEESIVMTCVEWFLTSYLDFLYLATSCFTVWLFWSSQTTHKRIGTKTEHMSATIFGSVIVLATAGKVIWDPEETGTRFQIGSFILLLFTFTNIFYVWFHDRIDGFSKEGLVHQTLLFSLSIILAFTAEFNEIVHIDKHIDHYSNSTMEHGFDNPSNGTSIAEVMQNLESFVFSLNFEFHFLLANYAYLISTQTKKPPSNHWKVRGSILDLFWAIIVISLAIAFAGMYKNFPIINAHRTVLDDYQGALLLPVFFFILSAYLYFHLQLDVKQPQTDEDKHENNVILAAACGAAFAALGGIPYNLLTFTNGDPTKKHTALALFLACIISPISIFFQTNVLRFYKNCDTTGVESNFPYSYRLTYHNIYRTVKKHWLLMLLSYLNSIQLIAEMLEVCNMGIQSNGLQPVVHRAWLIMSKALVSASVFYRLASVLRCVHHMSHSEHGQDHPSPEYSYQWLNQGEETERHEERELYQSRLYGMRSSPATQESLGPFSQVLEQNTVPR